MEQRQLTLHRLPPAMQMLARSGDKIRNSIGKRRAGGWVSTSDRIMRLAQRFDGFSIGSNDLTQLVLGIDRDSERLAEIFDERNPAVTKMIEHSST